MASTSTSGRGEQAPDPFVGLEPPNKMMKSSLPVKHFDVFINHRGPDVKKTLALQLYESLQNAGISAYLDFKETELGDPISSTIKNAIYSSRVHIAILSPQYAESPWCLAELTLMFQTKATIIPLFYNVEPADFRHIKGKVADAFDKHEAKRRYPNHYIQRWKDCLQTVSDIKGFQLNGQNDDLNKLCCAVVSAVVEEKRKRKIPLEVAKYAVGLDEVVKDFQSHCQSNGEMRDKIIGIFGMGGSGKTTLAKDLFNRKHSEFNGSTILYDVRESDVKGALTSLQSKLLIDLFSKNHHSLPSIKDGIDVIRDNLQRNPQSRFLIVIDDAEHEEQLNALVPMDALNPNSLVIVTTRDERFLTQAGVRFRYKMKQMNPQHSKDLFCWHAFRSRSCKSGFEYLVDSFVKACGGLPLALRVLGGHVFGRKKSYWKLQLKVVEASLHEDIKQTLKISYDALQEDQKQIFMDIACYFIGRDVSEAMSIWKASKWRAEHALQTLKDKCLVELQLCVDYGSRDEVETRFVLRMHDHLRDLGRDMAENEMSNPCRLWRPTDTTKKLSIITAGEEKNFRYFHDYSPYLTYLLEMSKTSTDLQWLQLKIFRDSGYKDIPDWIPLQSLQYLRLEGVSPSRLWQRNNQVPLKLKELCCISTLGMFGRAINDLVSSFGMLKHLEGLYLEFEDEIQILEWNCLLKSVRKLTNLKTLTLKESTLSDRDETTSDEVEGELTSSNWGETSDEDQFPMRSLEAITMSDVAKTRKVSISGQLCPSFKSLKLHNMGGLTEVDLTGVTTLECLVLLDCEKLRKVLCNDLVQLEMFRIKCCTTMIELPNFGRFCYLKRIYINECFELQDISAIKRLKGLKRIWIANCPELKNIEAIEQLKGLKRIWIEECPQLQGAICFKELKGLKRIFIGKCPTLQNIQGIESLIRLESIIISACPKLQNLRGIEELKLLKEMIISAAPSIICVDKLQRLPSELTILVGRPAISDEDEDLDFLNADKIGNILLMADGFCETKDGLERREEVEEMIHSFHIKSQKSLGAFIFCAMLVGEFVSMKRDICNGTKIVYEGNQTLKEIALSGHGQENIGRIYMCVVNEERLSQYDSWMPLDSWSCIPCDIEKAFLMGVKKGEEGKALRILQSLFTQLCVRNGEYHESDDTSFNDYHRYDIADIDDFHEFDDEDDECDCCDDDDHDDGSDSVSFN